MKPWITFLIGTVALIIDASASQAMSVQVKQTVLKSIPSFLGQNSGILYYGDRVEAMLKEGAWFKVRTVSKTGWLHATALSDKRIVLQSGSAYASRSVTSDEVTLAGKGFNAEVESEYRHGNPHMRFDLVDRMERYKIAPDIQRNFADRGKLNL
ncbi:MAG: hypothetical protein R3302_04465 [Sulfurimonadaceae bacterium]|nr:hypothetical protein [Sulfurimonadaceae bacterium]